MAAGSRRADAAAVVRAHVPPDRIARETRLVEDLALDSLCVAEVVVMLLVDYGGRSSRRSSSAPPGRVTVGDLYQEYCSARPSGSRLRIRGN